MFLKIDAYISRNVVNATAVVILVILGLDAIFTLVDELDQLTGDYRILDALQFMLLRLPRRLYEYLPLACLIGCLAGLGSMAANSELSVLRASGISIKRISLAVMKPMILLMLFSVVLAEYAIPPLERIAQSQKAVAQGKGDTLSNKGKGYWHREDSEFMRFTAIEPNGVLHGITIYEFDEQLDLKRLTTADRALYLGSFWQMEGVKDILITPTETTERTYVSRQWQTELSPSTLNVVMVQPRDMSISGLYQYVQYLQRQDLNADNYRLSLWRKITQPLSTFVLILLGISFIFGPLRAVTPGYRIFTGILTGLVYKYTEEILAPTSIVVGFEPIYASLVPIAGCGVLAFWLLRRAG